MWEKSKQAAAKKAVEFIKSGMIVGLGSGSTARAFIECLIERCKKGLRIQAIASSRASSSIAAKGGIEVLDINSVPRIDITVDGADEVDPKARMIKGGGGAHVREKILACASDRMIVIVDESKIVERLGKTKLPIEVLFFGSPATKAQIESLGYRTQWRMNPEGGFFITENGNLICDLYFSEPSENPEDLHNRLLHIPGVIETGFFFDLATKILVGNEEGNVSIRC